METRRETRRSAVRYVGERKMKLLVQETREKGRRTVAKTRRGRRDAGTEVKEEGVGEKIGTQVSM